MCIRDRSFAAAPQRARARGRSAGMSQATKLSLPRSDLAGRFRRYPARKKSATPGGFRSASSRGW
eukprot:14193690-Alexandrium_andersonii.AAC.1